MRAIVLRGPGRISLEDRPDPEPGPGEALIDVTCSGICGTDLQLARGYMDFTGIPGHEFTGVVSKVNSHADRVLLGARVTGEINLGCEECGACAEGLSRHCVRRRVLGILKKDGALAGKVTLPVRNLHVLPDSISDEQGVFVEPVAAAFEILDQVAVTAFHRVLVMGDGRLGLLIAQALATRGCGPTLLGRHEAKLSLARSLGLATAREDDEPPAPCYDIVVEATGSANGLDLALGYVRPRGTVVMKTTCEGSTSFAAWKAVVNEVTLVGSRCGRFEPAIQALATGRVKVDGLVSARLPLEEGLAGFRLAAETSTLKVILHAAG